MGPRGAKGSARLPPGGPQNKSTLSVRAHQGLSKFNKREAC